MASKGSANAGADKNVTKKHLVDEITRRTKLSRHDVQAVVQGVLDQMIEAVGNGQRIEIRDFGVFEVKERAARTAQNPKTLEPVPVPPKLAVRFKPGRLMKAALEAKPAITHDESSHDQATRPSEEHIERRPEAPLVEVRREERVPAGVGRD
ncbi:MAG: HU family DNA-binding protein [Phycisphaerales bacterium]|jgi:nucleoid DNA-binding protein